MEFDEDLKTCYISVTFLIFIFSDYFNFLLQMLEMFKYLFVLLRNWIQATFALNPAGPLSPINLHDRHSCEGKKDKLALDTSQKKTDSEEIDLSVDFSNMFVTSHYLDEVTLLVFLITRLKLDIYDKMRALSSCCPGKKDSLLS